MNRLPITHDLTFAYLVSLVIAVLMTVASVAGLVFGSAGLYGVAPRLVQVSQGGDAANIVVGLPILLGSMWLTRRGSLIGLLLLYPALKHVNKSYAAIGVVLGISAWALSLA